MPVWLVYVKLLLRSLFKRIAPSSAHVLCNKMLLSRSNAMAVRVYFP
jgi:hypothetical protein